MFKTNMRFMYRALGAIFFMSQSLVATALAEQSNRDVDTGMRLSLTPEKRYFVRLGSAYIVSKDKAGNAQDINGPIIPARIKGQTLSQWYAANLNGGLNFNKNIGPPPPLKGGNFKTLVIDPLSLTIDSTPSTKGYGIGSAALTEGVSQKVKNDGKTAFLSLGMYLDEEHKWSAETFLLGLPIRFTAVGRGAIGPGNPYTYSDGSPVTAPDGVTPVQHIDLGNIASFKLLPVSAIFTHYFGGSKDVLRPTAGLMFSYNVFMDAKASSTLEDFLGGPTKIKLKNAPGITPMLGLDYRVDDQWTLNLRVGYQFSKTTATVSTKVDPNILAKSPQIYGLPLDATSPGDGLGVGSAAIAGYNYGPTVLPYILQALALNNTGDKNNLGTFNRKIDIKANAVVFFMSIGYSF